MFSRYRIPLPPPVTDPSSPAYLADAEGYARQVRAAYDKRANSHRLYYRASGISVIVAGASLPLLTTLNYPQKSLAISLVGVFVSAVTALRAFYRWDHMWALLRVTEFLVTKAYWEWRSRVGDRPDSAADTTASGSQEATDRLLSKIECIRKMRPQNSSQRLRPAAWCMKSHLAIYLQLSDNCLYCQSSLTSTILSHIGRGGLPAGDEDFQSHVAARFGPFVVLLGQHRADQRMMARGRGRCRPRL
jgi:hypothetical protein